MACVSSVSRWGPPPIRQTSLLLHLIAHLEEYPASCLALLSARLRHELLVNLPVADVCRLERTEVVNGIDMESVWCTITHLRMPTELKELAVSPLAKRAKSSKEFYMEILAMIILNRLVVPSQGQRNHYHLALDLMFSIKGCLGIRQWSVFLSGNPYWGKYFHPGSRLLMHQDDTVVLSQRYLTFHTQGVTDFHLFYFLLNQCHYHPTQVNIFPSQCITPAMNAHPMAFNAFKQFINRAESVWFNAWDSDQRASVDILTFTTREMLANAEGAQLRHLLLFVPSTKCLEAHVNAIAKFFTPPPNSFNFRLRKTWWQPYTQLKELALIIKEGDSMECPPSLHSTLASIIQTQEHLEEVQLTGLNMVMQSTTVRKLISALLSRITQPTFSLLSLNMGFIPFPLTQLLTETFLASVATRKQALSFFKVEIEEPNWPVRQIKTRPYQIIMCESSTAFKHLRIYHMKLSPVILSWLFSPVHQLRLNTLELHGVDVAAANLLAIVAGHPNLVVENLYISNVPLSRVQSSIDDFCQLLSKDRLKVLALCKCNIGPSGLLQDLTAALMKQCVNKRSSLQELVLIKNDIGCQNDTEVRLFFSVLFSQPYMPILLLDIQDNQLRPHHFSLLYNAWQRHSHMRKLRMLKCGRNHLPVNNVDLTKVAQAVFF